jgi:hypothetical protein
MAASPRPTAAWHLGWLPVHQHSTRCRGISDYGLRAAVSRSLPVPGITDQISARHQRSVLVASAIVFI